ncbi:MAG: WG repeat-containing protein [Firmicutes bacterium]|nr:WG repeat-containing protein [Bacillota bacterium]
MFIERREAVLRGRDAVIFEPKIDGFKLVGRESFLKNIDFLKRYFGLIDREIIFEENDKYGIKDILSGELLIKPKYERLSFNRGIAVGELSENFYLYYNGELLGVSDRRVSIWDVYGFVFQDGYFFDVRVKDFCFNKPLVVDNDFILVSPMDEFYDIMLVAKAVGFDMLFGFKCFKYGLLVEPKFIRLAPLNNGVSMGITQKGIRYFLEICNKNERHILEHRVVQNDIEIFKFNDCGYAVFWCEDIKMYGVINRDFNIVIRAVFENIYTRILDNKFLLCLKTNAFFDFELVKLSDSFCQIFICYEYYIIYNMGLFFLKDVNLNSVMLQVNDNEYIREFDFIMYVNGRIMVLYNDYLWIFEKI